MERNLGKSPFRDPTPLERLAAFLRAHRTALARQGVVQRFFRQRGRVRCGPYYRIVVREQSRQCVHYLGKNPALLDRARVELDRLQRPRKEERARQGQAEKNRRLLRDMRRRINALLAERGLCLKGWELRRVTGSTVEIARGYTHGR
jgi:hypothetical protein